MAAMGGRHVVVTGGGRGIGRAIAERLAADGATLTLLARDLERLRAVADELGAGAAACDIRDRAQVDEAFAAAAAERGPIHALVANSGLGGPNEDGPDDRFDDLVATNLNGTYYCVRAALTPPRAGAGAARRRRDRVDPRADRRRRLHGLLGIEGRGCSGSSARSRRSSRATTSR